MALQWLSTGLRITSEGALDPSSPAPWGAWGWFGEHETLWEKREDKGQDAEG